MPAPRSKLGAIFTGGAACLVAVVILLMVPVIGVRKDFAKMILDWQELVLYVSCFAAATISGARLGYSQVQAEVPSIDQEAVPAAPLADEDIPLMTVPQIEESLAGGPKKPKKRFWTERTKVIAIYLYLVLFVMCAVLCQKSGLGSIVSDPVGSEIIRNVGLGVSVVGLYLIARGLLRPTKSAEKLIETEAPQVVQIPEQQSVSPDQENQIPKHTTPSVIRHLSEHVPPTRISFLKRHPVCTGWLALLTGLPLVFQAWFPIVAIPGIFVGMNWMFPDKPTTRGHVH